MDVGKEGVMTICKEKERLRGGEGNGKTGETNRATLVENNKQTLERKKGRAKSKEEEREKRS